MTSAIRKADSGDTAAIVAIHEAAVLAERGRGSYTDAQLEAWARRSPAARLSSPSDARRFFLLTDEQTAAAYAQLDLERGILRSLYVLPQYQHRGHGRRLADALLAEAKAVGLARLELDASLNSLSFYETLGFTRLGTVDHALAQDVTLPCVHMSRDLV
jgi:N-acetylglutamate synthase-like GNAT family acetyltransferase